MERSRETYRAAAREHLSNAEMLARDLPRAAPSGLILFLSGLATECSLRSLDPQADRHDPHHSLDYWFGKTGLIGRVPEARRSEIGAAMQVLALYWRSEHRYVESSRLARELRRIGLRSRKGERIDDPVNIAARRALESAILIDIVVETLTP